MDHYLSTLVPFIEWFTLALILIGAFTAVYLMVTPHPEIRLIREGNVSAAIAFAGVLLGYSLPLASVMVHGANIVDFGIWGSIALFVQLGVYFALRFMFKDYSQHVAQDHRSVAIFGASVSVVVGILNAAAQGG